MTTINLPMDVAREISKYNDHSKEIERLKEALAEQKTKTYEYAEYLFTVLEGEPSMETHFCDVCGFQCSWYHSTDCDSADCGKDICPKYGQPLTVCDGCTDEYFKLSVDYEPMCLDCYNGETKIPRIRRLTNAYSERRTRKKKEALERKLKKAKRIISSFSEDQALHYVAMTDALQGVYFCAPLMSPRSEFDPRPPMNPKDH